MWRIHFLKNLPHHSPRGAKQLSCLPPPPPSPSTQASQSSFSRLGKVLPRGLRTGCPAAWRALPAFPTNGSSSPAQLSLNATSAEGPPMTPYPLVLPPRWVRLVTQSCAISYCVHLMIICRAYCTFVVPVLTRSLLHSVTSVGNGACHILGSYM